ncbi:hypothetical protein [Kosmotoga pacifica]|uniref:Roadblock/LAMTOR2 domain-containing protein n=1 Tax=Kosmotoga pacifica TaxID=1330330 RepID=A0A0G2ZCL8_9BACT|nr:hypothetical protein [Kosmotoga pacifica]AKI96503.1 hypothetical protein IX53_00165 [Kosmotoga pacifica]
MLESEIQKFVMELESLSPELGIELRLINEKGESLGTELPCRVPSLSIALAVSTGTRSTTSSEGILVSVIPVNVRGNKFLLAVFGEVTQDTGYRLLSKLPELIMRSGNHGQL